MVAHTSPWSNMVRNTIEIYSPAEEAILPTLISSERYEWLHAAHSCLAHPTDFLQDLLKHLSRYHPRSKSLNFRRRHRKLANGQAIPPPLPQAMEATFLITMELFDSPLSCSMYVGITYHSSFSEDEVFGAVISSFLFRWTCSCIANPK